MEVESQPMTDTLAQEAPVKPKRKMSAEHKAKLLAGRAKWAAEKDKPPVAATPAPDATLAEIERLKAELAAVKSATGYLTPEQVAELPMERVFYEFVADNILAREIMRVASATTSESVAAALLGLLLRCWREACPEPTAPFAAHSEDVA